MARRAHFFHSQGFRTAAIAAGLIGTLMAVGPAQTASGADEAAQVAAVAAPAEGSTEVQRFCSNIADAARDRRYALQEQELEKLRADIDVRIKALEEKRKEYEEWLKRRDDFLAKAEDNVVKIYAKMKPDAAAERLAEVNLELAAGILMKLNPKQSSIILNEMDRKAAATITGVMAAATRKEDPS
jgi:flagellar motility protein MotE (MotC chaperone)